jgi:beta-glucosidase
MLAHGLAVQAMRANGGHSRLGIVLNMYDVEPATDSLADLDAARRLDGQQSRWYLDAIYRGQYPQDIVDDYRRFTDFEFVSDRDADCIAEPIDFLGINYYSSFMTRGLEEPKIVVPGERPTPWIGCQDVEFVDRGLTKTHMGWDVIPSGLTATLQRVARDYSVPSIYVMENGAAYPDEVSDGQVHDVERADYIEEHIAACHLAVSAGVPLHGYFVWSLLDNFEWAWGYERRFGIVSVDYHTQERTVKDSARRYAQIAGSNGLTDDSKV